MAANRLSRHPQAADLHQRRLHPGALWSNKSFDRCEPTRCATRLRRRPLFHPSHTNAGWFIGGGTEFALWELIPVPGLFWRIDYRYAAYNSADLPILTSTGAPITTCTGIGAVACGEHMQKDVQTVTTGLVWRSTSTGFHRDQPSRPIYPRQPRRALRARHQHSHLLLPSIAGLAATSTAASATACMSRTIVRMPG